MADDEHPAGAADSDRLPALLDVALSEGIETVEVVEETIDFGELAGTGMRAERTALAELLAGTEDKSSRAYKAQRRNVERWVKGRRPLKVSIERIVTARRQQSRRLAAMRQRGADVRLKVKWYGTRRAELLPAGRWLRVPREDMRAVIRQWASGDLEAAAATLRVAFYERYNVPNLAGWMREVRVTDLMLEPR